MTAVMPVQKTGRREQEAGTPRYVLSLGDCHSGLASFDPNSIDSMVTDPPAGIGFMGKEWDSDKGGRVSWIAWLQSIMTEARRVLKPGAHALVWAIPRTSHWTATALEQAGFEIRDVVTHHFGTGFPKSLNVSKAIDDAAGAERKIIGPGQYAVRGRRTDNNTWAEAPPSSGEVVTAPATLAAEQWDGWGTALKPASEHWILARKPLTGTVAANVQTHGTGALNIDACRIAGPPSVGGTKQSADPLGLVHDDNWQPSRVGEIDRSMSQGRWPANLILTHSADCGDACVDGCPVRELDGQSGNRPGSHDQVPASSDNSLFTGTGKYDGKGRNDSGGASRFFYVAKPSTAEREEGLAHLPKKRGAEITDRAEGSAGIQNARAGAGRTSQGRANHHPTVKSIALMKYLVTLVTPPGGIVLDPFCGSGTTGIAAIKLGMRFVGWELDPEYHLIAEERLRYAVRDQPENCP